MRTRTLLVSLALVGLAPAAAAQVDFVTPTGARLACEEISSVRLTDMPDLYGRNNFYLEYQDYVRLRKSAAHGCAREELVRLSDATVVREETDVVVVETDEY